MIARKLRIAILGSRGIPGNYGGFETCAEQLATRLVTKGHDVMVYCCRPYSKSDEKSYKGVKRILLPTMRRKALEKPLYAFLSLLHVCLRKVDVILMLGVSAAMFCFIPRIFGKKVAINIDGLEWKRKKWGRVASWYLRFSEKIAGVSANTVVADAKCVKEYYKKSYGKNSIYIAYGADIIHYPPGETLKNLGLQPREYILYVSRFDIENNPLIIREVFDEIQSPTKKLVMVGDAPFADEYIKKVRKTNNPNIIFTGYLFGQAYKELQSNAYFYIQATEVGGTHPALVEAMGAGTCVLANDVPEHREVLMGAGIYYRGRNDLKEKMTMLMKNEALVKERGVAALKIVGEGFLWDKIVDDYEMLFLRLIHGGIR